MNPDPQQIYGPFHNGTAQVMADPVRVRRLLAHHLGGNINLVIDNAKNEAAEVRLPALGQLAEATILAFEAAPFDPKTGQGLREDQALELLAHFLDWCKKKEQTGASGPTSRLPMVGGSLIVPMKSKSGSG